MGLQNFCNPYLKNFLVVAKSPLCSISHSFYENFITSCKIRQTHAFESHLHFGLILHGFDIYQLLPIMIYSCSNLHSYSNMFFLFKIPFGNDFLSFANVMRKCHFLHLCSFIALSHRQHREFLLRHFVELNQHKFAPKHIVYQFLIGLGNNLLY